MSKSKSKPAKRQAVTVSVKTTLREITGANISYITGGLANGEKLEFEMKNGEVVASIKTTGMQPERLRNRMGFVLAPLAVKPGWMSGDDSRIFEIQDEVEQRKHRRVLKESKIKKIHNEKQSQKDVLRGCLEVGLAFLTLEDAFEIVEMHLSTYYKFQLGDIVVFTDKTMRLVKYQYEGQAVTDF